MGPSMKTVRTESFIVRQSLEKNFVRLHSSRIASPLRRRRLPGRHGKRVSLDRLIISTRSRTENRFVARTCSKMKCCRTVWLIEMCVKITETRRKHCERCAPCIRRDYASECNDRHASLTRDAAQTLRMRGIGINNCNISFLTTRNHL